jgi:hypothetical protein
MAAAGLDLRCAPPIRHAFTTDLNQASGADLEIVLEQLAQASIKAATICAKVTKGDKARAADALAKAYQSSKRNGGNGASWPNTRHQPQTSPNRWPPSSAG